MSGARWKREVVQDHKFDFINVDDFVDNSCYRQFTYTLVFAAIIRGILVYCSDIFTAANLLANSNANSFVPQNGVQLEVFGKLPFEVYKYLFSGCILLGFLLLGLEIRRARAIIISRDISHAFTSLIASRFYTVRSYPHFCFFAQINNSKKLVDEVAFFCFFTFRNWKRLMLADAPRQVINATILYQTFRGHFSFGKNGIFDWDSVVGVGNQLLLKKISLGAMIFTVFMFALSLILLLSAVILYIPLVCHIRGNLKEYCCHKIDKRIDELIRKKSKTRAMDEAGKNGKDIALANMQQPTLPQVEILEAPVAPVGTPRTPYSQKTPKPAYNYAQMPPMPKQQQQQNYAYPPAGGVYNKNLAQQQGQHGYDYFQAQPPPAGMTSTPGKLQDAFDPYAQSAYTPDDIYDNYTADQERQHLQQSYPVQGQVQSRDGYGHGAYAQPGTGVTPSYYNNGASTNNSSSYTTNQAPPRTGRYDAYGQPGRPASPIQQHGSELDSRHGSSHNSGSHHSSQAAQGYGAGTEASAGAGAGAAYGGRHPRGSGNSAYGGNEYQANAWRQETGSAPRNVYRGGAGGGGTGY
ncbi:hypothetical protein EDD21DRAFT_419135 [Dissophora ornata]|nr:hypothetical protein EDD21DRAFT_419135 [Dissophora ornata]